MSVPAKDLESFKLSIGKTAHARFNANRRLSLNNTLSFIGINLASLGLVLVSLLPKFGFSYRSPDLAALLAIALSLCVMMMSWLISMLNFQIRAEKQHLCGMELQELFRKVDFSMRDHPAVDEKEFTEWSEDYQKILIRNDNHSPVDYMWVCWENRTKAGFEWVKWYHVIDFAFKSNWERFIFVIILFSPYLLLLWLVQFPAA